MTIFNSLGSHYNIKDAWIAYRELVWPNQKHKKELKRKVSSLFDGQAVLLFSGRDAIEYCLEAYGVGKGDTVLTQAFSCSSIEEAVGRTEAKVEYFDLAHGRIVVSLEQIKKAYQQADNPKAVILQHVLGYADEIEAISVFCQEKGLILIEDLAQSVGAVDSKNNEVGDLADAVILSFGRDKVLDGVAGGAVVFSNNSGFDFSLPKLEDWFELKHDLNNKKHVLKLLLYPSLTLLIRGTYHLGLGKLLHRFFKKIGLMESSIVSHHSHYQSFPSYFAPLVLGRINKLRSQLDYRQEIASYYYQQLSSFQNLKMLTNESEINRSVNLRFPILLESQEKLESLTAYLKQKNIYVEDRWYKSPVDSGTYNFESQYQTGSCPQAEFFSKRLLNLPTHREVQLNEAAIIVEAIKEWSD